MLHSKCHVHMSYVMSHATVSYYSKQKIRIPQVHFKKVFLSSSFSLSDPKTIPHNPQHTRFNSKNRVKAKKFINFQHYIPNFHFLPLSHNI